MTSRLPLRVLIGAALVSAVSGCGATGPDLSPGPAAPNVAGHVPVRPSMAWVSVPERATVTQRTVGNEVEQVVHLPGSAGPGDNRMILRASRQGREGPGRLRLEGLRARVGGFPAPFENLKAGDMISATDDLGSYSYGTVTYGRLTCVLAVRKVDGADRPIPAGRNALEGVLRNCVPGSAEDALRPIGAASFGHAGLSGFPDVPGTRLLSPLSAPIPD